LSDLLKKEIGLQMEEEETEESYEGLGGRGVE
jgi:hypothetical protein